MESAAILRIALCVTVLAQTCWGSTRQSRQPASETPTPSGACVLPPKPEFGNYTAPACSANDKLLECKNIPGSSVAQYWTLTFTCDEDYNFDKDVPTVTAHCINGSWTPSIPVCRRRCKPLKPLNMDVGCQYKGEDIDCSKSVPVSTVATGRCREGYEPAWRSANTSTVCNQDGEWSDDLVQCVPDCGREIPGILPLRVSGAPLSKSVLPWFVGIYKNGSDNQLEQYCGGTLISPHIVLTAAHCVYMEQERRVRSPETIEVALGKRFRKWTLDEPGAVKPEVREIAVSPLYNGDHTKYSHDIALIDLKTSIPLNSHLKPACVDWNRKLGVTLGQLGTLTGWGVTENGTMSDTLTSVELPYEETVRCISKASDIFKTYVTSDKFCSIPDNGTFVDRGYAGGGLSFVHDGRHYVQGVLSTKIKTQPSAILIFTSLKDEKVVNWLQDTKHNFDEAHEKL